MYAPPIFAGDAIRARIMGEVVASNSEKFKEGARVISSGEWAEYVVLKEDMPMLAPAM
jgi:NADPH-dependent curcumin reductase CurA